MPENSRRGHKISWSHRIPGGWEPLGVDAGKGSRVLWESRKALDRWVISPVRMNCFIQGLCV